MMRSGTISLAIATVILMFSLALGIGNVGHAAPPGAAPVLVTNTTANPVPTAAQGTTTVSGTVGIIEKEPYSASCHGPGTCDFIVAEGKRLVLESITGNANMEPGHPLLVRVEGSRASGQDGHSFSTGFGTIVPVHFQYSNGAFDFYGLYEHTLLQLEPGATLHIAIVGTGALSQSTVNVSGHFVPVS